MCLRTYLSYLERTVLWSPQKPASLVLFVVIKGNISTLTAKSLRMKLGAGDTVLNLVDD